VSDDDGSTARLGVEYKQSGDRRIRDQLIVLYSPLVKYVAARVAVGLPQHVDGADLASYGVIGLIDAIDRYDPVRQVKFETYAIPRIRGAIIDELRAIDWVPRSVRAKARSVEQAYASLEATLLRTPTDAEVAAELDISEQDLQDILRQISFVGVAALDEVFLVASGPPSVTPSPTPPPGRWPCSRTRSPRRSCRRPSCNSVTGNGRSCRSITTKVLPWPRSGRSWASPRAGSARSTPKPFSNCGPD
jgi:RNA polymerase sigma factor (sigma-70 family)